MRDEDAPDGERTRRVQRGASCTTLIELPEVRLSVVAGPERGKRFDLGLETIRIGSSPENDVVLADPTVSRCHTRLSREAGGWVVTDCGSSNGTLVDGVRVREGFLAAGSRLGLGESVLEIHQHTDSRYAVVSEETGLGPLIGASLEMRQVFALIQAVAPTTAPVLIEGESGTGKELAARAIHELSGRRGPLVVFDAAASSAELIRSELFGHSRGAFTGAAEPREGAFRRATSGTLFIDEFGELPLELQPNLLRALEAREVTPVGTDRPVPVDVRVVVATNRDLRELVAARRFREDLYHRVAVVRLRLPPLRERREDIPMLVDRFSSSLAPGLELSESAIERILAHDWPGNVRALRNCIERLGIVCRGRAASVSDLGLEDPPATSAERAETPQAGGTLRALDDLEREAILAALEHAGGNKAAAARQLGIGLTTLKRKLASFGPSGEGNG